MILPAAILVIGIVASALFVGHGKSAGRAPTLQKADAAA